MPALLPPIKTEADSPCSLAVSPPEASLPFNRLFFTRMLQEVQTEELDGTVSFYKPFAHFHTHAVLLLSKISF